MRTGAILPTALVLCAGITACTPSTSSPAPPGASAPADVVAFPATNRPDVRGTHGAVSADHPLAAQAGMKVLREGGNAMDAAVAMASVLAVVRPHMNGVGGDAFVLYYDASSGHVSALNGSGRSGALATPAFFRAAGWDAVPEHGGASVSVPGAVAAWVDAHERFGSRPFGPLLDDAIGYARDGFPVSSRLASDIREQGQFLNPAGRALYQPGGSPPPVGSLLRNPALARTLEGIAARGKDGFYRGPVADRIAALVETEGGHLRAPDLAAHASTWVEPLRGEYLGHQFLVMPPNTQGITQLQFFGMARGWDMAALGHNTTPYLHTLIELKKLAFADRDRWVADPDKADVPVDHLLDDAYLRDRAKAVDPRWAASDVAPGFGGSMPETRDLDDSGDTVYLTAVDAEGNAVSWIQSLYAGFGSGLLEPETGVLLQNRGTLYTLEDGHPNQVAPGKRPYHTLTPMMALRDGSFAFTLGTPGGDSQTQSLIQIVHNLLVFGMTPQEAVEAPRFRSYGGTSVSVEAWLDPAAQRGLRALGHDLRRVQGWTATFGGAQMILRQAGPGTLTVASDPRREAYGLAW